MRSVFVIICISRKGDNSNIRVITIHLTSVRSFAISTIKTIKMIRIKSQIRINIGLDISASFNGE